MRKLGHDKGESNFLFEQTDIAKVNLQLCEKIPSMIFDSIGHMLLNDRVWLVYWAFYLFR